MPSRVNFSGLEQMRQNFAHLERRIADEALAEAENAAARVAQYAIKAAAPRKTGQLARSVKIVRGKPKGNLTKEGGQTHLARLFVGPEKKKGYYGYFVEKGWKSTGSRRRRRSATATTHSQSGITQSTDIPGTGWFSNAAGRIESEMKKAAETALTQAINRMGK